MESKFQTNDLVIVKLRGHPHWPAIIDKIEVKGKSHIFKVTFFGTRETSVCRCGELSSYTEHKHIFFNGKKINDNLKLAINEIDEEIRKRSKTKPLRKSINKICISNNISTEVSPYSPAPENTSTTVTGNKHSISTTPDLGLIYQQGAVSQSLDKRLSEKNRSEGKSADISQKSDSSSSRSITKDFHTQILINELNRAKTEILSLNSAINCLQNDNKNLQNEIQTMKNKTQGCMHCFPALRSSEPDNNPWIKPTNTICQEQDKFTYNKCGKRQSICCSIYGTL